MPNDHPGPRGGLQKTPMQADRKANGHSNHELTEASQNEVGLSFPPSDVNPAGNKEQRPPMNHSLGAEGMQRIGKRPLESGFRDHSARICLPAGEAEDCHSLSDGLRTSVLACTHSESQARSRLPLNVFAAFEVCIA